MAHPSTSERSSERHPEALEARLTPRRAHVTGIDLVEPLDVAEDFHEASRLYPHVVDPRANGAGRADLGPDLRAATARAVKRYATCPFHPLPDARLGTHTFAHALAQRRSRSGTGNELDVCDLASLLHAGYGVTGGVPRTNRPLRTAPSGGALYPLELYVVAQRVRGIESALHHYDPLRHGLERLRTLALPDDLSSLTPYGELFASCAAAIVVTGSYWRSRFKYGLRGYRFALLEAGHVAQNVLLAVAALQLSCVPLGGFFDRRVDDLLGIDGVYESSLYLLPIWAYES